MPYIGYTEVHGPRSISGWCVDKENPETPARLSVVWRGRVLRTVRADRHRSDIDRHFKAPKSGFFLTIGDSFTNLLPTNSTLDVLAPDGSVIPLLNAEKATTFGASTDSG